MDFWARRRPGIVMAGMVTFAALALLLANVLWLVLYRLGSIGMIETSVLALVLATLLATRWVDRVGVVTVGLGWGGFARVEAARGAVLGFGLALLTAVCIALASVAAGGSAAIELRGIASMSWVGSVLVIALHAAGEELLYRGYLFQRLDELTGSVCATVVSVCLFVLAHASNPGITWIGLVTVGAGGLLFSLLVLRTGSLWSAILCHFGWNFLLGPVLGLPVSGMVSDVQTPLAFSVSGPGAVTGGAFGPEGSIAAAVLVLVGCVVVVRMRHFDILAERFARRFHALHRRAVVVAGETHSGSFCRSAQLPRRAHTSGASSPSIND